MPLKVCFASATNFVWIEAHKAFYSSRSFACGVELARSRVPLNVNDLFLQRTPQAHRKKGTHRRMSLHSLPLSFRRCCVTSSGTCHASHSKVTGDTIKVPEHYC